MRPQGFSPDVPCATFLTLDPHPGPHGQGLLPELELEPLPSNFPGPLGSYPSVGKSVHPVSAGIALQKPVFVLDSKSCPKAGPAWGCMLVPLPCH